MVPLQVFNVHACHLWEFIGIRYKHWQDGMVKPSQDIEKWGPIV